MLGSTQDSCGFGIDSHADAPTTWLDLIHNYEILTGFFYLFKKYFVQHCFISRPSDSAVPESAKN
jgi:hypothetical protein